MPAGEVCQRCALSHSTAWRDRTSLPARGLSFGVSTSTVSSKITPPTQLDPDVVVADLLMGSSRTRSLPVHDRTGLRLDLATMSAADTEPNSSLAGTGPGRNGDGGADQGPGHRLGGLAVPGVPQIPRPAHGRGLLFHPGRGDDGLAGGKQVVAGEPAGRRR